MPTKAADADAPTASRRRSAAVHYGGGGRMALGYDAADSDNERRRKATSTSLKSEDAELGQTDRKKVIHRARDLRRNFSLVKWMIRKHLDWVTSFAFQCKSGDDELDTAIEAFVKEWAKPWNCDLNRRHSFWQLLRLAEGCRVVDGDLLFSRLSDGRLQAIEGDRIQTPSGQKKVTGYDGTFVNGVQVNDTGAAVGYAICDRNDYGGFTLKSVLPARYCTLHAQFDRYDQVRGVSELACAANDLQDTREAKVLALAKMKASQILALVTKRASSDPLGVVSGSGDSANEQPFSVDFNKGPMHLDLDGEDTADLLESKSPSVEFQSFMQNVNMIALKALNLPYSFLDESFTNFFGSRQALINYVQSARNDRDHVVTAATQILRWRLGLAIAVGDLVLPAGRRFADVQFQLQPTSLPWWNPLQEIKADIEAINAGLISRRRLLAEQGMDFWEITDELDEEAAYIATKANLKPAAPAPPPMPPQAPEPAEDVADGYGPKED